MRRMIVLTLLGLLGIANAKAAVNCGPVQDPCSSNPTKTFSWTCADGQTCGSAVCVSICSRWEGFICSGNSGYVNVTFPMGNCNDPQG